MRMIRNSSGFASAMARLLLSPAAVLAMGVTVAYADGDGSSQGAGAGIGTMARVGSAYSDDFPQADKVVVEKAERKLHLMKEGEAFRTFDIALGIEPFGHKEEEGDNRTPEGKYWLDVRNPDSDYFLSIRISYPNEADRRLAATKGVNPGGQIMIHGQPNTPTWSLAFYRQADWTNGCIAVSNSDMIDIWLMTPKRVPIEILP